MQTINFRNRLIKLSCMIFRQKASDPRCDNCTTSCRSRVVCWSTQYGTTLCTTRCTTPCSWPLWWTPTSPSAQPWRLFWRSSLGIWPTPSSFHCSHWTMPWTSWFICRDPWKRPPKNSTLPSVSGASATPFHHQIVTTVLVNQPVSERLVTVFAD